MGISLRRSNNFDILRALAATMVAFSHSYPLVRGNNDTEPLMAITGGQITLGTVGVVIFFVISGFLISQSYDKQPNIGVFIKGRLLRLLPALGVVILLTVFIMGPLVTSRSLGEYFSSRETYKYLVKGISLFKISFSLPGVFERNPYAGAVNGSLWTIPLEIKCYIVVASLGITGLLRRKQVVAFVFGLIFLYSLIKPFALLDLGWLFTCFSAGMAFYSFRDKIPGNKLLAVLSVLMLIISAFYNQLLSFLPIFGTYLVFYFALSPDIKLNHFGKYGDFSYGIYIYAFPLQQLVTFLHHGALTPLENFLESFPIILLLSILSWNLVEKRCLELKNKPILRWGPIRKIEFGETDLTGSTKTVPDQK